MGMGYIGLPTAITFAKAGFEVLGFDINDNLVKSLSEGVLHIVEPGLEEAFKDSVGSGRLTFGSELECADVFIIAVQTPYLELADGRRVSELKYVKTAAKMLAGFVREGNLVVLESTVPPMTLREVEDIIMEVSSLSRDSFFCAHCPERVIPGKMLEELRNNDRVIGARCPKSAQMARELYKTVVTGGEIILTDDITAEMCKLVENTYRDINIAYANELSIVCDSLGIDVYRLIEIANCHPRVNIHTPGVGVGGHCIAVDPWFIHEKFEDITPLIATARRVNDSKPAWVADRISRETAPGQPVCVLGMTYKPDIDDLRESPSIELCARLASLGYPVTVCEPNIASESIAGFINRTLDNALESGDYLVLTLRHSAFIAAKQELAARKVYDCVGLI